VATTSHPTFGALLKRYRLAAGLTQEELAEHANLSVRAISDLERGLKTTPRRDTVELLAEALGLSEEDRAALGAMVFRRRGPSPSYLLSEPSLAGAESPPLVGRSTELTALDGHLGGAGPPVLLLAGEPGIGKTRLLQETCRRAGMQGLSVIQGGCQRRRGQEPYAPLLEALARHVRSLARAQLLAALRDCGWLVSLLPELTQTLGEPLPALPAEQERRLVFGAVVRFLARTAGPAGALLVLDDLQWAGADALDLLSTLAESAAELPLRIVGAYRDTELLPRDPFAATLADLARAGLATELAVGPLTPQEAELLLESLLEEREGAKLEQGILQRAGGVPFYLVSYAHALRSRDRESAPEEAVPWDLKQSLRQRMAGLPEAGQVVLAAAAVIGRTVRYELLARVVDQPEDRVLVGLEAACRARLLVEEAEQTYRFAHDVIREGVEADLGAARRSALHRRIAEALAGLPGEPSVEALAYHFTRGGEREKAALWLERAGDRARAMHANAAAEEYYRKLVECLEDLGRRADEARGREKLGGMLATMARYDEALEELEQSAQGYKVAHDLEGLGRATAHIGRAHAFRGTPDEGAARLQELLELLEGQGPSAALAGLYTQLALLCHFGARYEDQLVAAERAVELAAQVEDLRSQIAAEDHRGLALTYLGRTDEADRVLRRALQLAEAVDDHVSLPPILGHLSLLHLPTGDFDAGGAYARRAVEAAERLGDPAQVSVWTTAVGLHSFLIGDWHEARRKYEASISLNRGVGDHALSAYALFALGWLDIAEGAWDEASRLLQQSIHIGERTGNLQARRWASGCLAELDVLEGRPAVALSRLIPLLDRPGLQEWDVNPLLPRLAWAYLEAGAVEDARRLTMQTVERLRAQRSHIWLADALNAQGVIMARTGRGEEARSAFEEAVALCHAMPYPYAEVRVLYEYGRMHALRGEEEPACQRLEEALAISRRLRARPYIERTEQALAALDRVH